MKKILVLLLLLISVFNADIAFAQCSVIRRPIASGGGGSGCDECTGNLIFSAHFENNDDITQGTPCGCSTNADVTWSRTGATYSTTQKYDGSYSIYRSASGQSATITTDTSDVAGTLDFYLYISTYITNYYSYITFQADSSNWIYFGAQASAAYIEYKGSGTAAHVEGPSGQLTTGAWHHVVFKWSITPVSGHYMSVKIDNNSEVYYDVDLPSFIGTPSNTTIGSSGETAGVYFVDNMKVYDSWQ